jgi:predicted nucleic acid-binding protein
MNLVDSSGWLEYLADAGNADFFAPAVEDTENLIVSTVNLYEVFKRVLQQRGEDAALQAVALMQQARTVDVTSSLALTAARLSAESKLPMADSLVLAAARAHDATLWTQDSDFQGFAKVRFVKK